MGTLINLRSIVAISMVCMTSLASARTISDLDAVYKAATQRTLIMRITKDHLQMAAQLDAPSAQVDLVSSLDQYDTNLAQLELNAPNAHLSQRVATLKQGWIAFRSQLDSKSKQAQPLQLIEAGDELMLQADLLMRDWQARLPHHYGVRIDLAQQQSMLSERLSMLYTAGYMGVTSGAESSWLQREFDHTVAAYESGMQQLRLTTRDAAIDPLLVEQLASNWDYAKLGLEQFSNNTRVPVVMSVMMDSMAHQTDALASAYLVSDRIDLNTGRLLAQSTIGY